MIAVGIDPGLSGAIAIIAPERVEVTDMPIVQLAKTGFVKNAVDVNALARLLAPLVGGSARVFMEKVNAFPGQGVASMFSLGMSFWGAAGVIAGVGLPLELVAPSEWKARFKLTKNKDLSRGLAARLYPQIDLSRKKDHGRAEALLIARYGLLRFARNGLSAALSEWT